MYSIYSLAYLLAPILNIAMWDGGFLFYLLFAG